MVLEAAENVGTGAAVVGEGAGVVVAGAALIVTSPITVPAILINEKYFPKEFPNYFDDKPWNLKFK